MCDVILERSSIVPNRHFQIEGDGMEGGVARDSDALSLLDNRKTRNLLLDDLHELECFLLQRQAESGWPVFSC